MPQHKPDWLTVRMPAGENYQRIRKLIESHHLHTICQEANCPNRCECYNSGTATFLILGSHCTRGCTFCNVSRGEPTPYDPGEADRVADAVAWLELDYVVITSVTRDDLTDYGSTLFALVCDKVRKARPGCQVELLIPDFMGDRKAFARVVAATPDVLNHNLETVKRLYGEVRRGADYDRSLDVFTAFRELAPGLILKSGLMVGLGETITELREVISDLAERGCRILTIGQYLQPSPRHHPVVKFYHPDIFIELAELAQAAGIDIVESAPLVRSSYHAKESYLKISTAIRWNS
ncbi:MAG: lipoyl synthase [candidate division Zixibacteria bacterium]|nr:lipoyl synthase [candidate division Zixibacteria bacterium]